MQKLMFKDKLLTQLVNVFRQYGYEGATLARISATTGLGRASLYHHFPKGKEEMASAALNLVNTWLEESIITPLRQESEPIERLRDMSKNLYEFYSCGQQTCLFTMFALGESKDLFQAQIQKALNVWIDTLAQVLIDAGLPPECARHRAEDAILQIQGALILGQGLDETGAFERVIKRLPEQLLNGTEPFSHGISP